MSSKMEKLAVPMDESDPLPSSSSVSPDTDQEESAVKRKCNVSPSKSTFDMEYYLSDQLLGSGSFGSVKTCMERKSGKECAVKIIDKKRSDIEISMTFREVNILRWCKGQKQIIQFLEFYETDTNFYLVFEKAMGGSLQSQLEEREYFTEQECCQITKDIALGLRFLHNGGVAHRDIKPENVLCIKPDSPYPVKLCDFDLCSSGFKPQKTPLLTSPVGSSEFLAPELADLFLFDEETFFKIVETGKDKHLLPTYDKKCDLWALGVMMYGCLSGYPPFYASCKPNCPRLNEELGCRGCNYALYMCIKKQPLDFESEMWLHVSAEAKDLISKLLIKDRFERLSSDGILTHPWIVNGCPKPELPKIKLNLQLDLGRRALSMNALVKPIRSMRSGKGNDHIKSI